MKKLDGSFNIIVNGLPYNTIQGDKYYNETLDLYNSNPELFELETKIEIPLEELKQEKIQELKSNCSNYIYSKYPIFKQLNIANGLATNEEVGQMASFIGQAKLTCEDIEQQINSAKTQKELEKISTNFNQE